MILVNSGKPSKGKSGWTKYRKEHLVVMEAKLGRDLASGEIVHHIDNNKENNSIKNLHLYESQAEHRRAHVSIRAAAAVVMCSDHPVSVVKSWKLFVEGRIEFDLSTGLYVALKIPRIAGDSLGPC